MFATIVCFLPVVLLIVKAPDQFGTLLVTEKLVPFGKEFLFGVIGVLALSISDGMETISTRVFTETTNLIAQSLLLTTILFGLCCSAWIATVEAGSVQSVILVVLVSILIGAL